MARHALSWMGDRVSRDTLDDVIAARNGGGRPATMLEVLEMPSPQQEDGRDAVQDWLSDLLDGLDERISAAATNALRDAGVMIDRTALAMLRATGMDASIVLLLAKAVFTQPDGSWRHGRTAAFTLTGGPARGAHLQLSVENDGSVCLSAPIAPQTSWDSEHPDGGRSGVLVIARPLPLAVCNAMEGRALSDIVSHPVLDPLGFHVTGVRTPIGREIREIELDHRRDMLDAGTLALAETRPDGRALAVERPPRRRVDNTPSF